MKRIILLTLLCFTSVIFSQNKGTITGTVTDKELNNEPLPFANVFIKGTTIGGTTDIDGKYTINAPEGNQTIVFSFIGYQTIEKNIIVKAGETIIINEAIGASEGVALDEVEIKATVNKEKESALLLEQRKAVSIKTSIGAQELSKKGVSNVAAAVTKTAGIAKSKDKNVSVRGLGDRYNSTSLNGLPLASEDPEYKNISLDFFDTNIIKNIGVNKVFNAEIDGDVAGANIDILSKEVNKKEALSISTSFSANTQTLNKKNFLRVDGGNNFGVQDKNHHITNVSNYSFKNSYKPNTSNFQLNNSFSISGGKKYTFENDSKLNFFVVASMSNNSTFTEGSISNANSGGDVFQNQEFQKYNYTASQILNGTLTYKFKNNDKLSFNSLYIHSNKQYVGDLFGENDPQNEELEFLRRQQINDNQLYVNQILGKFRINDKLFLNAAASVNTIRGNEPDRRVNKYGFKNNVYRVSTNSAGENSRYFSILAENDYNGNAKLTYSLNEETASKLIVGGSVRYTKRDFEATIFNHNFAEQEAIDPNNPDAIFNQNGIDNNIFVLQNERGGFTAPFKAYTYNGDKKLYKGFANLIYQFNDNLLVNIGGRFERVDQTVLYDTNLGNSDDDGPSIIKKNYILPSLNIKYNFNENNILRIAGSQTYTLPQFKEVVPFKYQGLNFSTQGNPNLIPSDNYNFDTRYEYYLSSNEVISLSGFFKHISNPIARTQINSGTGTLSYLNISDNAQVGGIEVNVKKNIYEVEENYKITGGVNASYLYSRVKLDTQSISQFTNSTSELEGATPILINADISFNKSYKENTFLSTLVFNYFSDRIYAIGTNNIQNTIEQGIATLDFVSSLKIKNKYQIKLKANNILNPSFTLKRQVNGNNINIRTFKRGVNFSLSLSYNL